MVDSECGIAGCCCAWNCTCTLEDSCTSMKCSRDCIVSKNRMSPCKDFTSWGKVGSILSWGGVFVDASLNASSSVPFCWCVFRKSCWGLSCWPVICCKFCVVCMCLKNFALWFAFITWLKYCRYGVKHYPINQSTLWLHKGECWT